MTHDFEYLFVCPVAIYACLFFQLDHLQIIFLLRFLSSWYVLDINTAVNISPFGRLPPLLTMPFVYSSWFPLLYLTSSLRISGQTPAIISLPLLSHSPVSLPSLSLSSALLNAYEIRNGLLNTEQLGTWQICSLPSGVGIGKNACHFFGHFTGPVSSIIINLTRFGITQETHLWVGLWGCFRRTLTEEGKPTLSVSWRTRLRKTDKHPCSVSWQRASCHEPPAAMPSLLGYTVFPHTLSKQTFLP